MLKLLGLILLLDHVKSESHVCNATKLSKTSPPGTNFDLTHWKLTIPTPNKSTEIDTNSLVNGYQSEYFYTSPIDGSMSFYVPGNGGTTSNTAYPRSELRHMCNPSNDDDNWFVGNGVHELWANIRVDKNISAPKVIVAQIHGYIIVLSVYIENILYDKYSDLKMEVMHHHW